MNGAFTSRTLFPGLLQRTVNPPCDLLPLPPGQAATSTAALFHATAVLQRSRNSRYRFNHHTTRFRRKDAKKAWVRDASIYLEKLLQGYRDLSCGESRNYVPWFEKQYFANNRKKEDFHFQEYYWERCTNRKRRPVKVFWSDNDSDSEEFDSIFGSAFGGQEDIYGSFSDRDFYRRYSKYRNKHSWNWKEESDDESDTTEDSSLTIDRLALGLTATGPLKLEDVKKAYRACALKWHPDRHQGSTKALAEEKFKHCTAAYKAICDELAVAQT